MPSTRRLPLLLAVVLLAACRSLSPPLGPALELVVPREGQVIGGPGVLFLARSSLPPPAAFRPVFEVSQDGESFVALDPEAAPDYGPDSFASTFDATLFPSGPLWVRVRDGGRVAGPVQVRVNRLPVVRCETGVRGVEVTIDCSASNDADGTITAYEYLFGDDAPESGPAPTTRSPEPIATHVYDRPGTFTLRVTAYDDLGMWDTWESVFTVSEEGAEIVERQRAPSCGCTRLFLFTTGNGSLRDPRRLAGGGFLVPPLGPDPNFPSTNFEVETRLTPGSDDDLCMEGQEVRRSSSFGDKRACSAGRPLPRCAVNANCDTRTCLGGTMDGQPCDGVAVTPGGQVSERAVICALAGGNCVANGDGVCTAYPLAGAARGNDDYRVHFPGDEGIKLVCPACGDPSWLDTPGLASARPPIDYRYDADFLAFVRGTPGEEDCQCHFLLTVDWVRDTDPVAPGDQPGHRPGGASGITVIRDAETQNCLER